MCRHAAYLGPPLPLAGFLTAPERSLVVQSYAPRELDGARVCADGYGVGWLGPDGTPVRYRSVAPAWQDPNLPELARALASELFVANVRSATPPIPVSHENTHPFAAGESIFSHNGYVTGFLEGARTELRALLPPAAEREIRGGTDSEHLFALVREERRNGAGDALGALRGAFGRVAGLLPAQGAALLNVILASPGEVVATRHALGAGRAPSLYLADGHPSFPGGRVVASEPFDGDPAWTAVPEGHAAVLDAAGARVEAL